MRNERFPSSPEEETISLHSQMLRRMAKDLREQVEQSSLNLPNRDKVLRLVQEILTLVPVSDQDAEERDDFERKLNRGEVEFPLEHPEMFED